MDHIKYSLEKYSTLKSKSDDLMKIKNKIFKLTGIEPESLKIKNDTLYIKAKNNYEAVELRMQIEIISTKLIFKTIKIN